MEERKIKNTTHSSYRDINRDNNFEYILKTRSWDIRGFREEQRDDKSLVLIAVSKEGLTLKYVSERLKGDRDIVMAAVKNDGSALEYASEQLRGDKYIVMIAVKTNSNSIRFASEELRGDWEVVMLAVYSIDHWNQCAPLRYVSKEIRDDFCIAVIAVEKSSKNSKYVSESVRKKLEVGGYMTNIKR